MIHFQCKKGCKSGEYFIQESGPNIGLYCADCGIWQKWLGKDELKAYVNALQVKNANFFAASTPNTGQKFHSSLRNIFAFSIGDYIKMLPTTLYEITGIHIYEKETIITLYNDATNETINIKFEELSQLQCEINFREES